MIESSFAITGTFIAYLILMVAIGVYAYKKTSSSSDYFLGGRSLGPWPAALSAGASDMSGWLLLGLPGYAYAAGIESFWLAGGLLVGTWANWLVSASVFVLTVFKRMHLHCLNSCHVVSMTNQN
nr:hypothetical protein [Vibrio vulnificus]